MAVMIVSTKTIIIEEVRDCNGEVWCEMVHSLNRPTKLQRSNPNSGLLDPREPRVGA